MGPYSKIGETLDQDVELTIFLSNQNQLDGLILWLEKNLSVVKV